MLIFFHEILHRTRLTSPLVPPKIWSHSDEGKTIYVDQSVLQSKFLIFNCHWGIFRKISFWTIWSAFFGWQKIWANLQAYLMRSSIKSWLFIPYHYAETMTKFIMFKICHATFLKIHGFLSYFYIRQSIKWLFLGLC